MIQICVGVLLFFSLYYLLIISNVGLISVNVNTFLQPNYFYHNHTRTSLTRDSQSFSSGLTSSSPPQPTGAPVLEDCPVVPTKLVGRLVVNQTQETWEETEAALESSDLQPGGLFVPRCNTDNRVAIIVPYRDRESHLRIFLKHIHPILMRQNLLYR